MKKHFDGGCESWTDYVKRIQAKDDEEMGGLKFALKAMNCIPAGQAFIVPADVVARIEAGDFTPLKPSEAARCGFLRFGVEGEITASHSEIVDGEKVIVVDELQVTDVKME